jgi:hypothetical protein
MRIAYNSDSCDECNASMMLDIVQPVEETARSSVKSEVTVVKACLLDKLASSFL